MATEAERNRICAALMALLAERRLRKVGLGMVADRAGLSLATLRAAYGGRLAILADFSRRLDRQVLEQAADTTEEDPTRRLYDILAARLTALSPHRAALTRLSEDAWRDPPLGAALHAITARAMRWMLAGADIRVGGLGAPMRIEALTLVWLNVLRTWLDADDPRPALRLLERSLTAGGAVLSMAELWAKLAVPLMGFFRPRWPWSRR